MLRMKNITGEVRDLSVAVSNRVPEEERMQQKFGCKSRPNQSMPRMNNSSPKMGGEWGRRQGQNKIIKCRCPRHRQLKKFKNQMLLNQIQIHSS